MSHSKRRLIDGLILFLRVVLRCVPYSWWGPCFQKIGSWSLPACFSLHRKFRSNVAIFFGAHRSWDERERWLQCIAARFLRMVCECICVCPKNLCKWVEVENPEGLLRVCQDHRCVVFTVGHQFNWELVFPRLQLLLGGGGIAIGRQQKGRTVDHCLSRVRHLCGGQVASAKEVLKGCKAGKPRPKFLLLAIDRPLSSSYIFPLLGYPVQLSTLAATLAFRLPGPIVVLTLRTLSNGYILSHHPPIAVPTGISLVQAKAQMMNQALTILAEAFERDPEGWVPGIVWKKRRTRGVHPFYSHDVILILIEPAQTRLMSMIKHLYYEADLTCISPDNPHVWDREGRYQMLIDCIGLPAVRNHYLKLGCVVAVHVSEATVESILKNGPHRLDRGR